jgi:glycine C-acetyltransferase
MVNDLRENYGIFLSIVIYPVIPKGMILRCNSTAPFDGGWRHWRC